MQKEIWKDVPEYEGVYQVSNLGNVKSFKLNRHGILLNPNSNNRYSYVSFYKNGKGKKYRVHQLVAMCFLGHNPNVSKLVVDHINSNIHDNSSSNLRLITNRENVSCRVNTTSKYTGVHYCKHFKRYKAVIQINKKQVYLGSFKNEIDAHKAYQNKLKGI